ncbi:type III-B CRISPR module-associated Cmr3 family protein [uncultured Thiodictyon sp.]|uniref:type III-B CRISPR module-associated Cmr3 family protein n=1 Tax=uncultured Thiodictyon sp. TaxID=1846217 RepID=UPI0025D1A1B1|nr:type III-B CRISPR module-associated Cmr3 family protein [uncultured Thiodictyon sp.]
MAIDLVLSPRDGLTLKDARGFDLAGGVTASGLPWPGPRTTAGAARTVIGRLQGLSQTYGEDRDAWQSILGQVTVHGPMVVTRPIDAERWFPLWPAPQDALRLPHPKTGQRDAPDARIHWLEPRPRDVVRWRARGLWTDQPEEVAATEGLWLPIPDERIKPLSPRLLWSHDETVDWLRGPQSHDERASPQPKQRVDTHVGLDPATLAAKDEYLFAHATSEPLIAGARRVIYELGLALRINGVPEGQDITAPIWRIGGEGRFASAKILPSEVLAAPDRLADHWDESRFLRLLLVTPAYFNTGWRPDWLAPTATEEGYRFQGILPGINRLVALRSAFLDRACWISGWDLLSQKPKPSVACVAAGTVYYLESLSAPFTSTDIQSLWLSSIQQAGDAIRDGFGLILPGAWPVSI